MARTVWYPGHMAKGKRQLEELAGKLDLIIEVRDARAPEMTSSPMTEELARLKPVWIVLTKKDLADEGGTAGWIAHYRKKGRKAWAFNLLDHKIESIKKELIKIKPRHRELRLAVVGIPNVGKSALLNVLVGKKAAKVGGIPGVTRGVSWYRGKGFMVVDSPGILNPRSEDGVHRALAWMGCSKADVIGGYDVVAISLIDFLKEKKLWSSIEGKWGIPDVEENGVDTLERIGQRLGCLVSGGAVDISMAGRRFVESFCSGKLGRFTLEFPERGRREL